MASTVNPFATGVASDSAGIQLGDGIVLRLLIYIVVTTSVVFVLRYANKIKGNPDKFMIPRPRRTRRWLPRAPVSPGDGWASEAGHLDLRADLCDHDLLHGPVVGLLPGDGASHLGMVLPELAALFLVAAVIIGLVGKLGEEGMTTSIIAGMGDFMGAYVHHRVRACVTVIMNNAGITDTVLNSLESLVTDLSGGRSQWVCSWSTSRWRSSFRRRRVTPHWRCRSWRRWVTLPASPGRSW